MMGGKGLVWDVKDSLAADTDAPYRARICHAECGVCAPAARGRDRARTGERRRESGERRHAPSRRLRHRPRAHHRLLLGHCECKGMLDVSKRYQQGCTLRKIGGKEKNRPTQP